MLCVCCAVEFAREMGFEEVHLDEARTIKKRKRELSYAPKCRRKIVLSEGIGGFPKTDTTFLLSSPENFIFSPFSMF